MPYLGLIVWLILIWVIDCAINPIFIWITIAIGAFLVFCCVYSWWHDNSPKIFKRQTEEWHKIEREKAIDEWEKKWGRKHPSRK